MNTHTIITLAGVSAILGLVMPALAVSMAETPGHMVIPCALALSVGAAGFAIGAFLYFLWVR